MTVSSCGACKFLRRKCTNECIFTPYFCYNQGADHFAAVHKVFGASNVSKLLMKIPVQNRSEAAITICYEALARMHDPIYGCVAQIFALEQQVANLQEEIDQLVLNMGYVSFGLPYHGTLQEISDMNNGLPFCFQFNDSINFDHQTPLFVEPQDLGLLGNLQGQNAHHCSLIDHPVMENECEIINIQYQN
ncbi:hypothetical protein R6Q59_019670 [Mikania micrantha]